MRYCLLTGLALAMLPGLTPAAVFRVSRLDDPPAAPCQRGDCSLRGAVLAANARAGADTIVLGAGEHSLTLPLSFDAPGGPLRVTEALELRGAGSAATTIRQRRTHRVFQVESTDFRLTGATVRDGRAPLPQYPEGLGGCIHASNPQGAGMAVVLDDVILANCSSGFAGGALFVRQGEATLRRSRVTLNRSERGGGIGIDGFGVRLVLRDGSRIDRNQANSGGAIHADGGNEFGGEYDAAYVVIGADSVIDANTAGRGGAIASPFAKALAVGLLEDDLAIPGAMARIRGNAAENGAGGAIHSAGTLALHRVHLSNNEAASGGAVHVQRGDPNGRCADLWVFDSHIANNRATRDGGGILLEQGELHVEASTFHANRAGERGGALHYASSDSAATWPCHFGMASFLNTSFDGNIAAEGGGIAVGNPPDGAGFALLALRYSSFRANHALRDPESGDVWMENVIVQRPGGGDNSSSNRLVTASSIYTGGCRWSGFRMFESEGGNLGTDLGHCVEPGVGDLAGLSLASLALDFGDHGGPMPVIGLASAASPAIGRGTAPCPITDGRGALRPTEACDSGAFEYGVGVP